MKLRYFLVISALFLSACGEGKGTKRTPEETPDIEEFNLNFPRTFSASARYLDDLGVELELSKYESVNPDAVFGCLISGNDLTLVMRNGLRDQLRIQLRGVEVRESKSTYMNLVDISLDGRSPKNGFLFDSVAAGSDLQVEACDLVLQKAHPSLAGQLTCQNVTSQRDNKQAQLIVNFSCDIVK